MSKLSVCGLVLHSKLCMGGVTQSHASAPAALASHYDNDVLIITYLPTSGRSTYALSLSI